MSLPLGRMGIRRGDAVSRTLTGIATAAVDILDQAEAGSAILDAIADATRWQVTAMPTTGGVAVTVEPCPGSPALTPRELQVLSLLSRGLTNGQIARRLGISDRTAAHHVERILAKLDAPSRAAAARRAVEEGLQLLPEQ